MGAAEDRAVQCIRCGNAASRHGERPQDSPPGCGWTYSMVVRAAWGEHQIVGKLEIKNAAVTGEEA
ncbi:hypothetical protein Porky_44 [Mycobacterium phage Porky]|nr:hypothetical protein Porky_44 [Mycobacterium phage Porky]ACF33861.1 hypothetical protein Porky_44 [Mycobacterium phage Porky]